MNITYEKLRSIKHQLPTGSIKKIAQELDIEEQTVRNYFGAKKYNQGKVAGVHLQPGPNGGIVHLDDNRIIDLAMQMIGSTS